MFLGEEEDFSCDIWLVPWWVSHTRGWDHCAAESQGHHSCHRLVNNIPGVVYCTTVLPLSRIVARPRGSVCVPAEPQEHSIRHQRGQPCILSSGWGHADSAILRIRLVSSPENILYVSRCWHLHSFWQHRATARFS